MPNPQPRPPPRSTGTRRRWRASSRRAGSPVRGRQDRDESGPVAPMPCTRRPASMTGSHLSTAPKCGSRAAKSSALNSAGQRFVHSPLGSAAGCHTAAPRCTGWALRRSRGGAETPRPMWTRLERQPQTQLNQPLEVPLRGDLAKTPPTNRGAWPSELHVVEEIERLDPEVELGSSRKREGLLSGKIHVVESIRTHVAVDPRRITHCVGPGGDEAVRVEPLLSCWVVQDGITAGHYVRSDRAGTEVVRQLVDGGASELDRETGAVLGTRR